MILLSHSDFLSPCMRSAATHSTQCEFITVNGQTTTCAFHKVVWQQYSSEMSKTKVIYITFLAFVVCQKLLKSANVSRSCSKINTWTVF